MRIGFHRHHPHVIKQNLHRLIAGAVILFPVCLYSDIQIPIGAYNHPAFTTTDNWPSWYAYYEDMLDSAVTGGLGYFKPGWLWRDTLFIDTVTWITSEYPLEHVVVLYPALLAEDHDSTHWWGWWYRQAERYNGDGEADLSYAPALVDRPVKYWELSLLPAGGYPRPWRKGDSYYDGYDISWSLRDSLGTPDDSYTADGDSILQYHINVIDEYNTGNLDSLFRDRMGRFLEYFRVSAKAVTAAYASPAGQEFYIVGPGDAVGWGIHAAPWSVYVKEREGLYGEFLFHPGTVEEGHTGSVAFGNYYFLKLINDSVGEFIDIVSLHDGVTGIMRAARGDFSLLMSIVDTVKTIYDEKPFWESEVCIDTNSNLDSVRSWHSTFYRGWFDRMLDPNNDTVTLDDRIIFRSLTDIPRLNEVWGMLDTLLAPKETGVYDTLRRILHEYFPSPESLTTAHNSQTKLDIPLEGPLCRVWSDLKTTADVPFPIIRYGESEDTGLTWNDRLSLGDGRDPAMDIGSGGTPCVAWRHANKILFSHRVGPIHWSSPPYESDTYAEVFAPSIAIDKNDSVHVVWKANSGGNYYIYYVKFARMSPDLTNPTPIEGPFAGNVISAPGIAVSRYAYPHVCWTRYDSVRYRRCDFAGWRDTRIISDGTRPSIDIWKDRIEIVFEKNNNIYDWAGAIIPTCMDSDIFEYVGWTMPDSIPQSIHGRYPVAIAPNHFLWEDTSTSQIHHAYQIPQGWIHLNIGNATLDDGFPQGALGSLSGPPSWLGNNAILHHLYTEGDSSFEIEHGHTEVWVGTPSGPIPGLPVTGDTASEANPAFRWENVDADSYTVVYSPDRSFNDSTLITGLTAAEYTIENDTLYEDSKVWWYVKAYNDSVWTTCIDSFFWDLPLTYFCDPVNGDDQNGDGSRASPWKSLAKISDTLKSFQRCFFLPGIFSGEQLAPKYSGASSDSSIYYSAFPGNENPVILDADGSQAYGIDVLGKSYLTFDGLHLEDYPTASIRIAQASGSANHNTIRNCRITSSVTTLNGIFLGGTEAAPCSNTVITGTNIILDDGNSSYNIKLEYAPNTSVLDCDTLMYGNYGIRIATGSDSVLIEGSGILRMDLYGIYANGNVAAPRILDNVIHAAGPSSGIWIQESRNAEISGNTIDSSGTNATGAAIWCDTRCDHASIEENEITLGENEATIGIKCRTDCDTIRIGGNTFTRSGDYGSTAAIALGQNCDKAEIRDNIIDSAGYSGILVGEISGGCQHIDVCRNKIVSQKIGINIPKKTQSYLRIWNNLIEANCGIRNFGAEKSWFAYNTVANSDTGAYFNDFTGTADHDTLRNNIFVSEDFCIYMKILFSAPTGFSSDYNDLYTDGGKVGYWKGNRTTLSDWRSETDQDLNSIASDPDFAIDGFHLEEGSPCKDSGVVISWITDDYDGQDRGDPPDIGADQWFGGGGMSGGIASPTVFKLQQNRPNPFRYHTTIAYSIPKAARATLKVYDVTGRMVKQLINKEQKPGAYTVRWQGRNSSGRKLPTGVYFVRFCAGDKTMTKKLILMR